MAREIKTEAVVICLNSVATVFVALRAVSRFSILKRPAVDDYLIIVAVCLSWILTALVIARKPTGPCFLPFTEFIPQKSMLV